MMRDMRDSEKTMPWWLVPGGVIATVIVVGTFVACIPSPLRDGLVQLAERGMMPGARTVSQVPTPAPDHAPRITIDRAKSLTDALWVDVRSTGEYTQEHIPGARSLPSHLVDSRYTELPKDRPIVLYCT
jgi:hypothetical protein